MKNKIINTIKNNKRWCLLCICLIAFVAILEDVFDNEIIKFDTYVYNVISLIKTDSVTNIFKVITSLGSAKVLILITFVSLIILKNKKIAIFITLNLLSAVILNQILKRIIGRLRPVGFRLIDETGYSFPSGHSMVSTAFYGLIIYFIFKYVKNKKLKIIFCTILSFIIICIGISRIYLGVHYASDVIAGFLVSIVYLILFTYIIKKEI